MDMVNQEKMGYDRASIVFSPDGRLFQVEYARKAVEQGSPSVGVTFKDGVVLAAVKRTEKLALPSGSGKLHQIDKHIGAVSSGLISDGRVLVDKARIKSQVYALTYNEKIGVETLTKYIGDLKQMFTQYGGLRPMGVSFLIGGVDEEAMLFETDPGGAIFKWKAQIIGNGSERGKKELEKSWKKNIGKDNAVKLAIKALKKADKKAGKENIEIGIMTKKGYERLKNKEKYF